MEDQKIEVITFHGWAFSPQIWNEWEKNLPSGVRWKHADRGYFGAKKDPVYNPDSRKKILLVHSFGLHWCPVKLLQEVDHLILLSSFLSFHPDHSYGYRKSNLLLRKMMSRFVEKPYEVLSNFYKHVYSPDPCPADIPTNLHHDQLLHDLERLGESVIQPNILHEIPGITIIHGSEDRIINNSKSREMYSLFCRNSQYLEIKQSGHAAGLIHSATCAKFVLPALSFYNVENRV